TCGVHGWDGGSSVVMSPTMRRAPPTLPVSPYTTLFRSHPHGRTPRATRPWKDGGRHSHAEDYAGRCEPGKTVSATDYETILCMDLDPRVHDADDRLSPFLERFRRSPDITAYLDGNSLGRLPVSTPQAITEVVEHGWGERLIRGWIDGWVDYPTVAGDEIASAVLGAAAGQTVIADSTSVNIYKALRSAVRMRPGRSEILVE